MQESDKKASEPGPADAAVQHTRVRHVEVTANELNQRIDNFLLRRCPGVPRAGKTDKKARCGREGSDTTHATEAQPASSSAR